MLRFFHWILIKENDGFLVFESVVVAVQIQGDVKIFRFLFITKGKTDPLNPRIGGGGVFDLSHIKTENIAKKLDFIDF